jgi:AraC family transcriptional regulator
MGATDELALQSTPVAIERLTGAQPIFVLRACTGDQLTVAKWRFADVSDVPEVTPDCVLAHCTRGDAWMSRSVSGRCARRHMGPGDVAFSVGNGAARWSIEGRIEVVHVYLEPQHIWQRAQRTGHDGLLPVDAFWGVRDSWLDGYFQMLAHEVGAAGRGSRSPSLPLLEHSAALLVDHLLQACAHEGGPASGVSPAGMRINPLRPSVMRRVEAYIAANLAGDISLRALADVACMSVDHFARSFRAAQGEAPYRYVLTQRLRLAAALLSSTSEPISTIAERCGFGSAAHFTTTFTEHFGTSPSRHRRSFWDE